MPPAPPDDHRDHEREGYGTSESYEEYATGEPAEVAPEETDPAALQDGQQPKPGTS